MATTRRVQSIPEDVLERIVKERPHLAPSANNLRARPILAPVIEKHLAVNYLMGTCTALSASEMLALAACTQGLPYGTHGGG